MIEFNKLVRDKIPEKIKNNGEVPITRVLDNNEFLTELRKKLIEEYNELLLAIKSDNKEDILEESADFLEVLKKINELNCYSFDYILSLIEKGNNVNNDLLKLLDDQFKEITKIEFNDKENILLRTIIIIKIIKSLNELNNYSFYYVLNIMDKKREKKGGFQKKIFLIKTLDSEDLQK